MALIRALNSGVSGLRAFQTKMDVIGNNIANVETAGFKSSRVTFAELMTQRLGRTGQSGDTAPQMTNQVGLGVRVSSIDRDFSQGVMQNTGRSTDLALEGKGFFMVSEEGQPFLTRAGNFQFNKDGFLVDPAGRKVQGYNADSSGHILRGGATQDVYVDFENIFPPRQTNKVNLAGNLDANTSRTQILQAQNGLTTRAGQPASQSTAINDLSQVTTPMTPGDQITFEVILHDGTPSTITYNYTDGDTVADLVNAFNDQIGAGEGRMSFGDGLLSIRSGQMGDSQLRVASMNVSGNGVVSLPSFTTSQEGLTGTRSMSTSVYDDLGRTHSLTLEFRQVGDNEWVYEARFADGKEIRSGSTGTVRFDSMGNLVEGGNFDITFDPGNGAEVSTFNVELGDSSSGTRFTQYAGTNSAKVLKQDGYAQGQLIDIGVDGDGRVQGMFDNGKSRALGQLAVAMVQNEAGLEMLGSGLYQSSFAAGEMYINTAADFAGTTIASGALEASNVDLAKEFTEMITSQRAYQSNARVISTADEMLMEAVNLKR